MFGVYLLVPDFLAFSNSTKTSGKGHSFYNTVSLKKSHLLIFRTLTHLVLQK